MILALLSIIQALNILDNGSAMRDEQILRIFTSISSFPDDEELNSFKKAQLPYD